MTNLTAGQAAKLQLLPGIASLPVFAVLAWLLAKQGVPNIFALLLTVILVETPLSWAILVRHVRKENGGKFSVAAAFPWMASVPWWTYLLLGIPLIVFSAVMVAGVSPKVGEALIPAFFSWLPDWFVMHQDPAMFSSLSRELLFLLWGAMLLGMVLLGGFTQELYSRGFLLPRMAHMGKMAPAYNAFLFAVFHLIAPWNWISFFLMTLPWAYMVWWCRSIRISLFIHVGMLSLQWLGMTVVLFGFVSLPGQS